MNKKLRLYFYGVCQKCFCKTTISKDEVIKRAENQRTALESGGILCCSKCGSIDMSIHYSCKNVYVLSPLKK